MRFLNQIASMVPIPTIRSHVVWGITEMTGYCLVLGCVSQ